MMATAKTGVQVATADVGQAAFFQDLPEEAKCVLQTMQSEIAFPAGSAIFSEGQAASGVFFLVEGRVRLSVVVSGGRAIDIRLVKPGGVFGLSTTVSGDPHRVTAVADAPSKVLFIRREDFLPFVHAHPEVAFRMVEYMSKKLGSCFDQVRSLG